MRAVRLKSVLLLSSAKRRYARTRIPNRAKGIRSSLFQLIVLAWFTMASQGSKCWLTACRISGVVGFAASSASIPGGMSTVRSWRTLRSVAWSRRKASACSIRCVKVKGGIPNAPNLRKRTSFSGRIIVAGLAPVGIILASSKSSRNCLYCILKSIFYQKVFFYRK